MSLMKTLEMFIADNPGLTSREIADAFSNFSIDSVQRTVCRLHDFNFTTRELVGSHYRYFAVNASAGCGQPTQRIDTGASDLIKNAKALQEKGLYRRAASLWFEAFQCSDLLTERERCLKERQRCLRQAKSTAKPEGQWFLAGQFNGGH
ncbi:PerC family transcriptional regulator [Leclercia sp. LSNIH1]|uniref:PerC family transcriptional regulator n=1 Tax=Leclercia sp. LSNIH1 TaxID=1920114 RepID=UPI000CD07D74|nr:PerC family transcriptional regulator [Leclercia sp. LSNIH1]AUU85070.1 hypothetical protein C2U54_14120 [Leclercia sp. LSNIH1]POV31882.1 hypothetical protein C3388_24390 [Leclercia sp. LSNIH5]POW60335.1 hypothetical protein C3389_24115 [Leclercia sp. LSNIH2]